MADEIVNADVVIGDVLNVTVDNVTETVTVTLTTEQEVLNATIVPGTKGDKGDKGDVGTTDYNELINTPDLTLKADKSDTYTKIEVDTSLAGKAELVHVHAISDVTGLQTALDGKSATGHTHTAANVTDFDTEVSNNTDVAANTSARHTHANSAVLDATTASFTTADETKLDGISAGAQVNAVTSVNTRTGAVTGLAEASDVTTALSGKVDKTGDVMTGSLAATTFTAGTATDVLGTAFSVIRNNVAVGRIDNNASGLRVQAQNGSLQLRGTGNTGIAIDALGNAVVAGNITGANLSGTNTGDNLIIGTVSPTPATGAQVLWLDTTGGNVTLNLVTGE